ncbi:TPA: hypothetical protein ACVO3G_004753, partial [Vibrio diabolicus]
LYEESLKIQVNNLGVQRRVLVFGRRDFPVSILVFWFVVHFRAAVRRWFYSLVLVMPGQFRLHLLLKFSSVNLPF